MIDKVGGAGHAAESCGTTRETAPPEKITEQGMPPLKRRRPSMLLAALPTDTGRPCRRFAAPDGVVEQPDGNDDKEEPAPPASDPEGKATHDDLQSASPPGQPPSIPIVAGGREFPPPDRAAIYAAMGEIIDGGLAAAGMARLYALLGAVNMKKLTLAIQAFEVSQALRKQSGRSLTEALMHNSPVALPASTMLRRTDFLLWLKCLFFYPVRSATIKDDHALVRSIIASGLDSQAGKQDATDIALTIGAADQPYGLIKIKLMIDELQKREMESARNHPDGGDAIMEISPESERPYAGAELSPEERKLIVDEVERGPCALLGRDMLERLCEALATIDNTKMIEVAARVSQASVALRKNARSH